MLKTKQSKEKTLREQADQVITMMGKDFDWNAYQGSENIDDLFRACCRTGAPSDNEDLKGFYECGSVTVKNTPKALYRLLFLLRPKSADFSDMYKSELFTFGSVDSRFWVQVYLFKYELGLYFFAPKDAIAGNGRGVIAGWPGADNGRQCADEDGRRFFEMVAMAANRKWMVYGGNDFEV